MSMQEKGRKHGADRQNFLRKRGRAGELTSVSRRGRPRPYINVASWRGSSHGKTVGSRKRFGQGPVGGRKTGDFGALLLARSWPAVGVWSWRDLESRLRAGSFAPPGQYGQSGGRLRMLRDVAASLSAVVGHARGGMSWVQFSVLLQEDPSVRAVEILDFRVYLAWIICTMI